MTASEKTLDDLHNGNLTDARNRAKRIHFVKLLNTAIEYMGYSEKKARLAATYLKTKTGWQEFCDCP